MARRKETDHPPLYMVRQHRGLVPASDMDAAIIERYAIGARLRISELTQPRDEVTEKLTRTYWAVVSKVAKAIGVERDSLHWQLRLAAGLHRDLVMFDGSAAIVPRSITELDGAEFRDFVDRAFAAIGDRFGINTDEILAEARRYGGGV